MKIFISHASHDKWVARQISSLLVNDGHITFLDEKDINTGESIDAAIQANLKDSDHLLLLLSPASIKSQWVFIELGGAKALNKRIIPILFHVAANEIPHVITQLLARDINEFDKYLREIKPDVTPKPGSKRTAKASKPPTAAALEAAVEKSEKSTKKTFGQYTVGDTVQVVDVSRLTDDERELHPKWVKGMDKYSGARTTITAFSPMGNVYLALSGDEYKWHPNWITKVA